MRRSRVDELRSLARGQRYTVRPWATLGTVNWTGEHQSRSAACLTAARRGRSPRARRSTAARPVGASVRGAGSRRPGGLLRVKVAGHSQNPVEPLLRRVPPDRRSRVGQHGRGEALASGPRLRAGGREGAAPRTVRSTATPSRATLTTLAWRLVEGSGSPSRDARRGSGELRNSHLPFPNAFYLMRPR